MDVFEDRDLVRDILDSFTPNRIMCKSCKTIVGIKQEISGIIYHLIGSGYVSKYVFLIKKKGNNSILKISENPKLIQDSETESLINGMSHDIIPKILDRGDMVISSKKYFWVFQEYIPGIQGDKFLKSQNLTETQIKNLACSLKKIHNIKPGADKFFGRAHFNARKKYYTFNDYIGHFVNYIEYSNYFELSLKTQILKSIQFLLKRISSKTPEPCLIHGDFQERNILILGSESPQLIDFGDAKWSTKEAEFATMFAHTHSQQTREKLTAVMHTYEQEFGPLDSDIFDLFCMCCLSFKMIQRNNYNSETVEIFNNILIPIINKYAYSADSA